VTYRDESRADRRVPRRTLLAAGGGLLITGTAAAVTSALGPRNSARPARAAVSGPRYYPHPAGGPAADFPEAYHPEGGKVTEATAHGRRTPPGHVRPAKPVYYVDDGPKAIALTIDDGPSPVYTPQILRLLERYGITASFSMIGRNVAAYPGVAREVAAAGHAIVNHTWDHADLASLRPAAVRDEISRAADAIHGATGVRPGILRAPYGAWSPAVLEYCAETRMIPLDWSVDPRDWAMPGVASIVNNIMSNTRSGSIILEHDGGGNRSQTVAALRVVIPRLLRTGYRFRVP
jgi:peptidoglycan-N-acetylglucosamine deacetylase